VPWSVIAYAFFHLRARQGSCLKSFIRRVATGEEESPERTIPGLNEEAPVSGEALPVCED
jgi:hypothetical protein